jgi:CrcB protein
MVRHRRDDALVGSSVIPLMVALGAAVGAPARYVADRAVQRMHRGVVPIGTLAVNVAACAVLGFTAGAADLGANALALLGTGFCGALSTFSAFSYETVRLTQRGKPWLAALNVALSLVLGLGAAAAGWAIGSG